MLGYIVRRLLWADVFLVGAIVAVIFGVVDLAIVRLDARIRSGGRPA